MLEIALFQPEIPPNTGNISRLCVCTGVRLHIVGKPAFSLDQKDLRRAGLDYWDRLDLVQHADFTEFQRHVADSGRHDRTLAVSKYGPTDYWDYVFKGDEVLLFGNETSGLPGHIHEAIARDDPHKVLRVPMSEECRSLNLANTVAIVLFEGLRQARGK